MKTIKIIDLLNKIANGEEVPKKIRIIDVYSCDLIFDEEQKDYSVNGNYYMFADQFEYKKPDEILNIEVEIIEEDKEIEDTKYMRHHEGNGKCYIKSKGHKYYVPYDLLLLIDNLVKAVNELKKGK